MDKYLVKKSSAVPPAPVLSNSNCVEEDPPCDSTRDELKRKYKQKIRNQWLNDKRFSDWLISLDDEILKCKYCYCTLQPKFCGLLRHQQTKKHKDAIAVFMNNKQSIIPFKSLKDNQNVQKLVFRAELRSALFIANHSSMHVCDHFILTSKKCFDDSQVAGAVRLKRTKCTTLIKDILYPYFLRDLVEDIGTEEFSLIIDESTDLSVVKQLGIVIRYYSKTSRNIVTTFLKLQPLENSTARGICAAIKDVLKEFKLEISSLKGLGTDNANVMVGINQGVISLLREINPKVILIPCACHSIQLAVSHATVNTIPNEIEFLISETYNWFSKSAIRQEHYKKVYRAINDGYDPLKIVRACQTRWLSLEVAVKRINAQWIELKTHFEIAANTESCHMAKILAETYKSNKTLAYCIFLKCILSEIQWINKIFESKSVDPTLIFKDLCFVMESLCSIVVPKCEKFDPFSSKLEEYSISYNFPYEFEKFIQHEKFIQQESNLNRDDIETIKNNCANFTIKLIYQIRQRLPTNMNILRKLSNFSVEKSLSAVKPALSSILKEDMMNINAEKSNLLESQWRKLHLVDWCHKENTLELWSEIREYRSSTQEKPFAELSELIFQYLILPISNAEVERIFSTMNLIKTKQRNRLKSDTTNAILFLRSTLRRKQKCCFNYELPEELIEKTYLKSVDSNNVDFNENEGQLFEDYQIFE